MIIGSRTVSRVLYCFHSDHHSSGSAIARALLQPTRKNWPGRPPSLLGLAPNGACLARHVTMAPVGSYPTFSPLPAMPAVCFCGAFQGSPPLDVIQRPALWSPDFPPRRLPRRWSVRLPIFYGICQLKLYQYQPCSPMLHSKKRFAVRYWPSSFLRFSGLASPSSSAASSGVREASGFGSVLFCLISSGISKC